LPFVLALMVFIVVCLFNSLHTTLLIWLVMPLVIISVTVGLLLTGLPFGFMALLGVLDLGGELIKNQLVVLSKILTEIKERGKVPYQAILDGGTSKMRPVCMVVLTTVLGMIPLLKAPFFGSMVVCIMFGLSWAAVLTLIVTPVMYAIFFNVRESDPALPHHRRTQFDGLLIGGANYVFLNSGRNVCLDGTLAGVRPSQSPCGGALHASSPTPTARIRRCTRRWRECRANCSASAWSAPAATSMRPPTRTTSSPL
jgi:hypothetical protein